MSVAETNEQVRALEDMLDRTTRYMTRIQNELRKSKSQLEERNELIDSSLRYSARIQDSLIPSEDKLRGVFTDCYLINMPKDTIGGDTLWMRQRDNYTYIACIDCTGHGIPGAMLTMAAQFTLNSLFEQDTFTSAKELLSLFNVHFAKYMSLNSDADSVKDAMDLSILVIDREGGTVDFSAVNHEMVMIRDGKLRRVKGVTHFLRELKEEQLESVKIDARKGDIFMLCSDGFEDQFGGERNKRFSRKRMLKLFTTLRRLNMGKQKEILVNALLEWQGTGEQTDDILVFGFKW